jgi:signal transduction histidine kinase
MPAPELLYERLRRLAVEDPREARGVFLAAFEAKSPGLADLFARLRKPNAGRLRQVVANSVRAHPEKARIVSELLQWRETETDEFTRRAIDGALVDVDSTALREDKTLQKVAAPSELVDMYRYVADRLRHRLRNTMLAAQAQASRLNRLTATVQGSEVQTVVAKLNDAMISMGRELEATDVDPEYFRLRPVALPDWLRQLNARYATQYSPVKLSLIHADHAWIRVLANDYLLETIFWNIWLNAQQSVGENCEITIFFGRQLGDLEMMISDNGEGFSPELREIVFQQVYSSKNNSGRGRGLMEIQDAVERLAGRVELYEAKPSDFRIRISVPLETQ